MTESNMPIKLVTLNDSTVETVLLDRQEFDL